MPDQTTTSRDAIRAAIREVQDAWGGTPALTTRVADDLVERIDRALVVDLGRVERLEAALIAIREYQAAYVEAGRLATAVPRDPRGLDANFARRKAAKAALDQALAALPEGPPRR